MGEIQHDASARNTTTFLIEQASFTHTIPMRMRASTRPHVNYDNFKFVRKYYASYFRFVVDKFSELIGHFTVVCLVTWP